VTAAFPFSAPIKANGSNADIQMRILIMFPYVYSEFVFRHDGLVLSKFTQMLYVIATPIGNWATSRCGALEI